jgi:hypothetical protein
MIKNLLLQDLHHWYMFHKLVKNSNLRNIEKNLQRLLHVETLHPNHVVPELEQDCDTGSRIWILNRDRQYHDTSLCFASLDNGLTPQLASTSLQLSRLVHCVHGRRLSHLEPFHANHDHDHQSWKLMKIHPKKTQSSDTNWRGTELRLFWQHMIPAETMNWR